MPIVESGPSLLENALSLLRRMEKDCYLLYELLPFNSDMNNVNELAKERRQSFNNNLTTNLSKLYLYAKSLQNQVKHSYLIEMLKKAALSFNTPY